MSITTNKKAFHDYFIEEKYEAGLALEGWEVKAIRAGRMNIKEAYVIIRSGEIFLIVLLTMLISRVVDFVILSLNNLETERLAVIALVQFGLVIMILGPILARLGAK